VAYDLKWNRIHFNPKAGFRLSANDLLVLIGHEYSITHFKDRLESGGL
jgi:voltage-gated potassium channel